MKSWVFALLISVLPAFAQPQNITINVGTPEGQMLQSIGQETDDAKKVALMEDFLGKFPKHEGAPWVCGLLELSYLQQKQFDRALEAAEKVYTGSPNDLDLSYNAIKAAEGKDDPAQIKKWAVQTSEVAKKITGSGKAPADDTEKQIAEHAKEVATYADYSIYAAVLKSKDLKTIVDLGEALEHADPKSQYMWLISERYLAALGGKGCGTAAKLSASDSKNAEAMMFEADCSWRAQPQRAEAMVSNASRALEALNSRGKVEGGNEGSKLGMANFYLGVGNALQQRFGPADKALRAALPSVKGSPQYGGVALFYLGLANYQLGKAIGDKAKTREGLQFFEQSAAVKGIFQDQAARNVTIIKAELGVK
jgi:tetratricopeptide (TPR) repeat protein